MLVVITIIGLIMSLVGPRVLNYLSESKVKAAKIQIESLSAALDLFDLDNGRYPASNEGLTALCSTALVRERVERPLSQDQRGARRSLGPSISLQSSRRSTRRTRSPPMAPPARGRPPSPRR